MSAPPETGRAPASQRCQKRSRMRKRKMPITMKAIRNREGDADLDHKRHALAPVAARTNPFLERHEADDLAQRRCAASP